MRESIYAADFETNGQEVKNMVWAYGLANIYKDEEEYIGTNIDDFMFDVFHLSYNDSKIYFHNLKFDGMFIFDWLLNHGYKYLQKADKRNLIPKTFTCLVDDTLTFYNITIYTKKKKNGKRCKSIEFRDSFKKIPMKISQMPKAYGLDIEKGNLDDNEDESYDTIREPGHELTDFEKDYLMRDVRILKKTLKIQYDQGLTSMTAPGDAMKQFKEMLDGDFSRYFPELLSNEDSDIRKAYRGGWTYCVKKQMVGVGLVLDVNSLYPSVLFSQILDDEHFYPYGVPEWYEGKYENDPDYPLYVCHIRTSFRIRDGFLPTIQLNKTYKFGHAEYSMGSDDVVDLWLTSVDFELFKKHYKILTIEYVEGYKFKAIKGLFDKYITKYIKQKIENNDNKALRTLAKLFLNSLYGKFGMSQIARGKHPVLIDGKLKFIDNEYENGVNGKKGYERVKAYRVDVAAFCTAYARRVTITAAQKLHEVGRFCYGDTDSVHITGTDLPDFLWIDKTALGAWDHESDFKMAKFIRSKTYAEYTYQKNGSCEWEIKCAGMTEGIKEVLASQENFLDLFDEGFTTTDLLKLDLTEKEKKKCYRLKPKIVKGGVILVNTPFTINFRK